MKIQIFNYNSSPFNFSWDLDNLKSKKFKIKKIEFEVFDIEVILTKFIKDLINLDNDDLNYLLWKWTDVNLKGKINNRLIKDTNSVSINDYNNIDKDIDIFLKKIEEPIVKV